MVTFRQQIMAIFGKQPVDRIVWQPRLEHWYNINKQQGTLPDRYKGISLMGIYDDLRASPRPYDIFNEAIKCTEGEEVHIQTEKTETRIVTTWRTPVGTLRAVNQKTYLSELRREFPIKRIEDLKVMEYILRHRRFVFDEVTYRKGEQMIGERAAPTIYIQRVPLQRLYIEYMGFENTIYALHDHPKEMEAFIRVIEETDDALYKVVKASPIEIINFGDNVDANMMPPPLFKKYTLPYYQRRTAELRAAGKFIHPHWDGAVRSILPFARETGFDGFEALTPLPQGDVTLEEIKAALGDDLILIDGIPATHFLPQTSYAELQDFTRKVLDMFSPNLILGISDELPPDGDIEKVRLVSQIVRGV